MTDHFLQPANRCGTNSVKWDRRKSVFGTEDVLPMWVADADWQTAPKIIEELNKRTRHGIFGYTKPGKEHDKAIINWFKRRHNWEIQPEWIVYLNGVMPGVSMTVNAFTEAGDGVITQPPVYFPFYSAIENNGAKIIKNQLKLEEGSYRMDLTELRMKLDLFEDKSGSTTPLLLLCSPHNPVGRVWQQEELEELGKLCLERGITVISDEIHSDFVYEGYDHTAFASISREFARNSITFGSPSKSFNLAGLQTAYAIIPDENLREKFQESRGHLLRQGTIFGLRALKTAYGSCEQWFEEQLAVLEHQKNYTIDYFRNRISGIEPLVPEGTYLIWLDCRGLGMDSEELARFFVNEARVGMDHGSWFGEGGNGFMRLNIACPKNQLEEALHRIEKAVAKVKQPVTQSP